MKIAVMSDIHSNLFAFGLVLADAKAKGAEHYIFCGDYVSDGPDTDRIIQRIRALPASVIRGNREDYMLAHSKGKSPMWEDSLQFSSLNWIYNRLSQDSLNYLKTLPATKRVVLNKKSILISHGSPYKARDVISPYRTTQPFDRILSDFDDDIFIFGHTHKQWQKEYQGRFFLNPGSVGAPTDGQGFKYSMLEISDKIVCEQICIPYNFSDVEAYYKTAGFVEDNGIWGRIMLFTIRDGVSYIDPLLAFCYEYARRQGVDTTTHIPNDLFIEASEKWEKANWRVLAR